MGADFFVVLQWWGTLFLVGAAAFPLTKTLFSGLGSDLKKGQTPAWYDRGYLFSKAVGMAVVSWIVYVLGTLRILPFTTTTIVVSLSILFVFGMFSHLQFSFFPFQSISQFTKNFKLLAFGEKFSSKSRAFQITNSRKRRVRGWNIILLEELFFLILLLFWSWVKAHEPSIRGLEKFMDYGFMQSILNSRFFPPADMWLSGSSINYYYFGHLVTAVLTRLSGLDLSYTFNLMLATIFALTLTMSFSIGKQISHIGRIGRIGQILGGVLTAWLVTLAGNMQTVYAFTRGYTGDPPEAGAVPFWKLLWGAGEFFRRLPEGLERYWYPNATRFIPFTIHEFPSYSFVVSDVHGHVLSLPFVLLAIALLIKIFSGARDSLTKRAGRTNTTFWQESLTPFTIGFYGFLVGVLLMTNAIDGPIYFGLFAAAWAVTHWRHLTHWTHWLSIVVVIVAAGVTSLPFLSHFKSFVAGIAVNCAPEFLANRQIGPLLFEGVEKCQHSALWMLWLLWGFFIYCGAFLVLRIFNMKLLFTKRQRAFFLQWNTKVTPLNLLLTVFFVFSVFLIIFPEFLYFKDIYPAHFRSNTMFKLGYQAFILLSIVSGYAIVQAIRDAKHMIRKTHASFSIQKLFVILLLPQLFLVSIYPIFSVRSYFNSLRHYEGIFGLGWLRREYPDDYAAIEWLNFNKKQGSPTSPSLPGGKEGLRGAMTTGLPVVIEADGESYTDYGRISAFTGLPAVIGWPVHEWLWRGSYDPVSPRRQDVQTLYETGDEDLALDILRKYSVRYVVVGTLEREKYPDLRSEKFAHLGEPVFTSGNTVVYEFPVDN